jgi:peptidoglycan/LPS O-acetylase OafA/YrhL
MTEPTATTRTGDGYRYAPLTSTALDAVRVFASQLVLFGHAISILGLWPGIQEPHAPYLQNVAVVIFFVLSGNLIAYAVMQKLGSPGYGFRSYFVDRFSRIHTGLLPALVVVLALDLAHLRWAPDTFEYLKNLDVRTFVGNVLMLQHLPGLDAVASKMPTVALQRAVDIEAFGSARPLWTAALEWWLYLLFGWALLARPRASASTMARLGWVALAGVFALPLVGHIASNPLGSVIPMWFMGAASAWALRAGVAKSWSLRATWAATLVSAVASIAWAWGVVRVAYDPLFAVGLALTGFFGIRALDQTRLEVGAALKKALTAVADFSYSLYLVHYSVLLLLCHTLTAWNPLLLLALCMVVSNGVAWLVAQVGEAHHRKVRVWLKGTRFFREPAAQP